MKTIIISTVASILVAGAIVFACCYNCCKTSDTCCASTEQCCETGTSCKESK